MSKARDLADVEPSTLATDAEVAAAVSNRPTEAEMNAAIAAGISGLASVAYVDSALGNISTGWERWQTIWDGSVDPSVQYPATPMFELGYDYRVVFENCRMDGGASQAIQMRTQNTSGVWSAYADISTSQGASTWKTSGLVILPNPVRPRAFFNCLSFVSGAAWQSGAVAAPRNIYMTQYFNGGLPYTVGVQAAQFKTTDNRSFLTIGEGKIYIDRKQAESDYG